MKPVQTLSRILTLLLISCFIISTSAHAQMTLSSDDLIDGQAMPMQHVFNGFGCKGDNISPQLSWSNVPKGTKSLALNVYDPDAPTGSGWWHWSIFNLPPSLTHLDQNASSQALPKGAVQGLSDYGFSHYGGACPPAGDAPHRYIFTLYALNIDTVPLDQTATGAMIGYYLNANAIEKASLTVTYGRDAE